MNSDDGDRINRDATEKYLSHLQPQAVKRGRQVLAELNKPLSELFAYAYLLGVSDSVRPSLSDLAFTARAAELFHRLRVNQESPLLAADAEWAIPIIEASLRAWCP